MQQPSQQLGLDDRLQKLGAAVTRRRLLLDQLSIDDAARGAGMSPTTWTNIEKGRTSTARSRSKVEQRLGWLPGSSDRIMAGGEPEPDPEFEQTRIEKRRAASERSRDVVIVDLSSPDGPVVILAAGGHEGLSETTRRRLVNLAREAIDGARGISGIDAGHRRFI